MARGPGHRPLIVLRWIFLGLLLVAVAVVVALYLRGGPEPEPPRAAAGDARFGEVDDREVVLAAEGFEYEVIDEGKTLFLIRADRMVSDRANRFVLEGVELTMTGDGGEAYRVRSNRAEYDLETRDADLQGSVRLLGPDGVELASEGFKVERKGQLLSSTASPASFTFAGGYTGTAEYVRIHLERHFLVLRGDVQIDSPAGSEPRQRMSARRMLYRESEQRLRAEGGVRFEQGDGWITGRRLSADFLARDGKIVGTRAVQARWEVTGRLPLADEGDRARAAGFTADRLSIELDPESGRIEQAVLEERANRLARLVAEDGAGLRQTVSSRVINVRFAGGAVRQVETLSPTTVEETLAGRGEAPLRRLCGDALAASFDREGGLAEVVLDGSVDYQDGQLAASSQRLEGDPDDSVRLTGDPVRGSSDQATIEAPEIVYSRADGRLQASGGVRAREQGQAGIELAPAGERVPVTVTSDEAVWKSEPSESEFTGNVRAWQGESYLLADRLVSLDDGTRLEAEGSVKSVWRPAPDDASGRRPVEVHAGAMVYLRAESELRYREAVRVHEAGRVLACQDLRMQLDAERSVESMLCRGDTLIDDPVAGRTVRGVEALYTPADRRVLITGEPVVLQERDGTLMRGRRLAYDLDSGEVQILSDPRPARENEDAPIRADG